MPRDSNGYYYPYNDPTSAYVAGVRDGAKITRERYGISEDGVVGSARHDYRYQHRDSDANVCHQEACENAREERP